MKKVISTLALSLIISAAFAFRGFSELNLKIYDNSLFYVVLDNVSYNFNQQTYSFKNLAPGNHYLTVVKIKPSYGNYGYGSQSQTVYSGYISIPGNQKIFSMINPLHKFVITSSSPFLGADDTPIDYEPGTCNNNFPGTDDMYYENDDYQEYVYPSVSYNYTPVMSSGNFSALLSLISSSSFDSSKQLIAKQAINTNWFTSAQICEVLNLFTFESSKLAIAKLAYARTIDKTNYFLVNNAFTFESSTEELTEYIAAL